MQAIVAFIKNVRPFLVKGIAVLMGICYLLAPLHKQIGLALHSVSHFLEMPGHVMSHDSLSDHDSFKEHIHLEHEKWVNDHHHGVLDFFDSVFEASNDEDDSQDALTPQIKIDKHFVVANYVVREPCLLKSRSTFSKVVCEYSEGYSREFYNPPRNYSLA